MPEETGTRREKALPKEIELTEPVTIDKPRVFVNPPVINIGSAPSVKLINHTGGAAEMWFPNGDNIFDAKASGLLDFSTPIDIPLDEEGRVLIVKDQPAPGRYKYSVFCAAVNGFAQGNSEPQMDVP